jgi:hypothetical protein
MLGLVSDLAVELVHVGSLRAILYDKANVIRILLILNVTFFHRAVLIAVLLRTIRWFVVQVSAVVDFFIRQVLGPFQR